MSTRKIIAATASVAIMFSTIAVFESSSHPPASLMRNAASLQNDARPVTLMDPVVVRAEPLQAMAEGNFQGGSDSHAGGFTLTSMNSGSASTQSELFMPYYSFATNLHTMIKE